MGLGSVALFKPDLSSRVDRPDVEGHLHAGGKQNRARHPEVGGAVSGRKDPHGTPLAGALHGLHELNRLKPGLGLAKLRKHVVGHLLAFRREAGIEDRDSDVEELLRRDLLGRLDGRG